MAEHAGKRRREKNRRGTGLGAVAALAAALLAAPGGCAKHTEPVVAPDQMQVGDPQFARMWQAAKGVLRDYRFELDRQDRRAGVITTEPLLGRHGLEFWRRDAVTAQAACEGALQTIYRTATVHIAGRESGYEPDVRVEVFRSDRRTPQVSSTADAYRLFRLPGGGEERSRYLVGYGGQDEEPPGGLTPLGRDEPLEQTLAAEIRRAAAGP